MSKHFGKALFLCPKKYSLFGIFNKTLDYLADEVFSIDIRELSKPINLSIHSQIFRAPFKIRDHWENNFLRKINKGFLNYFNQIDPDIVVIYNSEFLLPETCEIIKKNAKLIFFLGDSPFYTLGNNYFLSCLTHSDMVLCPDTFWQFQLDTIGIENTHFFVPGINSELYYKQGNKEITAGIPISEILYIGMSYVNSWGYKKALFMNQFVDYDLRIYGSKHWKKWFNDFPALKDKFTESGYIPVERLNMMMNRSKIIPVDGNPGILNGFHLRLFEALGAGSLPIVEYRNDVEHELFKGCKAMVPLVRNYKEAGEIAGYYLKNENERKDIVKELKDHIIKNFSPEENADRILSWLSDK